METPRDISTERLLIADQYGKLGERKVELLYKRATHYKENREDHKSDASMERAWELTNEGLELMVIKEKMKSKLTKMSALKTALEVANAEAYNQY